MMKACSSIDRNQLKAYDPRNDLEIYCLKINDR